MAGFLFNDVVFGPVRSRRLGLSLGINLLPMHSKYCSFNCIYCECGWTPASVSLPELPPRETVKQYLEQRLVELAGEDYLPHSITFAGNGEPTLHPDFAGIVDDTIILRDRYAPRARIAILSNASMLHLPGVFGALLKVDENIQKLDAGFEKMFLLINNPVLPVSYSALLENLRRFEGKVTIQSMFIRGQFKNQVVDNTLPGEVDGWVEQLREIRPGKVMIYPIARATPVHSLEKIPTFELDKIAEKVRNLGIETRVYH
jgi:wyosine [tRNA(Phe)-imidazoG37] synthetase (radical SAM superfamily)